MDFDLDPFGDTIPEHASCNARAGGKFQPKSKARPKKETPSTLHASLSSATKEKSVRTTSSHNDITAVKPITPATDLQDSVQSFSPTDPEDPSSELIGAEVLANKTETSHSGVQQSDGDRSSETVGFLSQVTMNKEDPGSMNTVFLEAAISNSNLDIHSGFGKLGGEAGDIFFGLESLDNILPQANTSTSGAENNFQCNVGVSSQSGNELITSHPVTSNIVDSNVHLRDHILHSFKYQDSEEEHCIQVHSSVNSSTFRLCKANATSVSAEFILPHKPVNSSEAAAIDGNRHMQIDNLRSEIEEVEAFHGLDTLDIIPESIIAPVKHRDEFLSKSKVQNENERPVTSVSFPDAMASISCPGDAQLSSQIYIDESSVPTFRPDGFLDFSTMRCSETAHSDHPHELLVTEEPTILVEASHPDVVTSEKVMDLQASGGTSRRGTRKKKQSTVLEETVKEVDSQNFEQPSQRGQDQRSASTAGEENEASKSSRRPRKRIAVCVPPDEREDWIGESENFHKEASDCSDKEEDEDEYRGKDMSRKRRASRKLKERAPENDGPVRRHKKTSEGQDPSEKKPHKKRFSHSTKRKKRLVDKVLLETPEDEINPQKLIIRDLILLAEAKERSLIKEVAALKKSFPNKSASNSVPHDASYNEDESFASMQALNSDDDQASEQVQHSSSKVNYHSHMDRTPSKRWSKQDTELFYEAIRQFGTDFAMIQQLFPDRTRHQVKLKYNKEERQYPMRLSDALTNRSKDHYHFELVIQRLQAAAELEKNSDGDVVSVDLTDEEEVTHEENEVGKSEQKLEEQVANDLEPAVPEVCNTAKSLDSEDDFCRWSQYRGADYSYPEGDEKGEYGL